MNTIIVVDGQRTEVIPFNARVNATERKLERTGELKPCLKCRKPFVVGKHELLKAMHEYKGRNTKPVRRTHIEVFNASEIILDVDLTKNPIDLSQYSLSELATIYNVSDVSLHICPKCKEANHQDYDDTILSSGRQSTHFEE